MDNGGNTILANSKGKRKRSSNEGEKIKVHFLHIHGTILQEVESDKIHQDCPALMEILDLMNPKKILRVNQDKTYPFSPCKVSKKSKYFQAMFSHFSEKDQEEVEIELPFSDYVDSLLYFLHFGVDKDRVLTTLNIIPLLCNSHFLQAEELEFHFIRIVAKNWNTVMKCSPYFGSIPTELMQKIVETIGFQSTGWKMAFLFMWSKTFSEEHHIKEREMFQILIRIIGPVGIQDYRQFTDDAFEAISCYPAMLSRFGGLNYLLKLRKGAKQHRHQSYDIIGPDFDNPLKTYHDIIMDSTLASIPPRYFQADR